MKMIERKIYYYDTDCGGVVYYANYLKFFEEARSDYLEKLGFSMKELIKKGILFAIRKQEVEYKAPIRYGEIVKIKTWIKEVTPYRIRFYYEIENESGKRTTTGTSDMVCVNSNMSLMEIPPEISKKLKDEVGE